MNSGIGDYILLTFISSIASFLMFGFEWFGIKISLFCSMMVIIYAVFKYVIITILEFKKDK